MPGTSGEYLIDALNPGGIDVLIGISAKVALAARRRADDIVLADGD